MSTTNHLASAQRVLELKPHMAFLEATDSKATLIDEVAAALREAGTEIEQASIDGRNEGAETFAKIVLADDEAGVMAGPCGDLLAVWRGMKAEIERLKRHWAEDDRDLNELIAENERLKDGIARLRTPSVVTAEELAKDFHETYERLAPSFSYETRKDSAKPWESVPEKNRALMTAVCGEIAARHITDAIAAERAKAKRLEEDMRERAWKVVWTKKRSRHVQNCSCQLCILLSDVSNAIRALPLSPQAEPYGKGRFEGRKAEPCGNPLGTDGYTFHCTKPAGHDSCHASGTVNWNHHEDAVSQSEAEPQKPTTVEETDEKRRRIYYQDIVYAVCRELDRAFGKRINRGEGIMCGTVSTPSTQVQDLMRELVDRDMLRAAKEAVESVGVAPTCLKCGGRGYLGASTPGQHGWIGAPECPDCKKGA